MNLIEGIQSEANRYRKLLNVYKKIPAGNFGAAMLEQAISNSEKAVAGGDILEMIRCYKKLEGCE